MLIFEPVLRSGRGAPACDRHTRRSSSVKLHVSHVCIFEFEAALLNALKLQRLRRVREDLSHDARFAGRRDLVSGVS